MKERTAKILRLIPSVTLLAMIFYYALMIFYFMPEKQKIYHEQIMRLKQLNAVNAELEYWRGHKEGMVEAICMVRNHGDPTRIDECRADLDEMITEMKANRSQRRRLHGNTHDIPDGQAFMPSEPEPLLKEEDMRGILGLPPEEDKQTEL